MWGESTVYDKNLGVVGNITGLIYDFWIGSMINSSIREAHGKNLPVHVVFVSELVHEKFSMDPNDEYNCITLKTLYGPFSSDNFNSVRQGKMPEDYVSYEYKRILECNNYFIDNPDREDNLRTFNTLRRIGNLVLKNVHKTLESNMDESPYSGKLLDMKKRNIEYVLDYYNNVVPPKGTSLHIDYQKHLQSSNSENIKIMQLKIVPHDAMADNSLIPMHKKDVA